MRKTGKANGVSHWEGRRFMTNPDIEYLKLDWMRLKTENEEFLKKLADKDQVVKFQAEEIEGLNQILEFQSRDKKILTVTEKRMREIIKEIKSNPPRVAGLTHKDGLKYLTTREIITLLQGADMDFSLNPDISNPRQIAIELIFKILREFPEDFQVIKSPYGRKKQILVYTGGV